MCIHSSNTAGLIATQDECQRAEQPPLAGEACDRTLEIINSTWGSTSPYASYSQTLIRAPSFSDDFENAITPNTPQGYRAGKYF
jgi:hypothetical protein